MSDMVAVENANENAKAFFELSRVLRRGSKKLSRDVGWPGAHGHYTVDWHKKYGFWSLTRTDVKNRFWCAYGTQNPEKNRYLNITCEINPPKGGRNQRCAGVFLRNSHGQLYLGHNGKVGGGKKGVGKNAFRL